MSEIILVRHGETRWNRELRWQGHLDIPLGEEGMAQANLVAGRLSRVGPCLVWSSDLERAYRTAVEIASRFGGSVRKHSGLREVLMGEWQGLTHEEILEKCPLSVKRFFSDFAKGRAPGGESFEEMAIRVRTAMDAISTVSEGALAIAVTHGGPIKAIVCDVLGISPAQRWRFRVDNAGITRVMWDEACPRLLSLNDTGHLRGESC